MSVLLCMQLNSEYNHIMHIVARFLSIWKMLCIGLKISLHQISYKRICSTEIFAQAQLIHAYIHYFHLKLQSNLFIAPKMSIQCFFSITAKDSYVYFFLLSFISNIAKRFKLISILIIRCFFSSKEKKIKSTFSLH